MYTYTIDSVNGNDRNDGSPAAPLRTHAEMMQRGFDTPPSGWGKSRVLKGFPSVIFPGLNIISVNVVGDLLPDDPIDVDITMSRGTLLGYVGTPRTIRTGTLTTVVTKNRTANQPWEIQDAGTPFTAADVGRRIRITASANPANVGQLAWGARLLPNGNLRVSSFSEPGLDPVTLPDTLVVSNLTTGIVTVGDTYVVEELSVASIRAINARVPNSQINNLGFANFNFRNSIPTPNLVPTVPMGVQLVFKGCKFDEQNQLSGVFYRTNYVNCCAQVGLATPLPTVTPAWLLSYSALLRGGLCVGSLQVRGTPILSGFDDDFMVQSGSFSARQGSASGIAQMCVFDSPVEGVAIGQNAVMTSAGIQNVNNAAAAALLWGSGNLGAGVKIYGGSELAKLNTAPFPIITGSNPGVNDFILAGETGTFPNSSRAWDETVGAYTTPRPVNSWAELAAPIAGANGFGGRAHNLLDNVHIVLRG